MLPELTPKQEAFARAYVETGNASGAYRQAYEVGPETKPETIWSEASRTLANPLVTARVMELQEAAAERSLVTVDSLTKELEEARQLALSEANPSAAVSAIMGKAKLHGLGVERREIAGKDGAPIATKQIHTLDDESAKKLAKMMDELVR
jgi:phage terminase small subunit